MGEPLRCAGFALDPYGLECSLGLWHTEGIVARYLFSYFYS